MKATILASECKTRAIQTAEATEGAVVEVGLVTEDTGGGAAAWEAAKVMKNAKKCTSSSARRQR